MCSTPYAAVKSLNFFGLYCSPLSISRDAVFYKYAFEISDDGW